MPAPVSGNRLIISTLTSRGTSAVLSDETVAGLIPVPSLPTIRAADLWIAEGAPADIAGPPDLVHPGRLAAPGNGGHVVRLLEIAPDPDDYDLRSATHVTPTLDHVVVLSGEVYCVFEEGEVLLRAGDILVQRGVRHAWSNRGDQPCRMLGVLVDASATA
jgi:mannose-6-phosphate isomerase-like protein (cupin superfamily)